MELKKIAVNRKITAKNRKMASLLKHPAVASWRLLSSAFQINFSILEEAIIQEGLSYSRFQILSYLYFDGPSSAACLAQDLYVSRANMSTFCKRLEIDELVIQRPAKVGSKRNFFHLTKKGSELFEKVFPSHIERVKKVAIIFSSRTTEDLLKLTHDHICKEDYFDE